MTEYSQIDISINLLLQYYDFPDFFSDRNGGPQWQ